MRKRPLVLFSALLIMITTFFSSGSISVYALAPPDYYEAQDNQSLVKWIKTSNDPTHKQFLDEIRHDGRLLAVTANTDEFVLQTIMVHPDQQNILYVFDQEAGGRILIYTHLFGSQLPLDESAESINNESLRLYEGVHLKKRLI